MKAVAYGRTAEGQMVYDLCFADLSDKHLARKHGVSVSRIRELRSLKEVAALRLKVLLDRKIKK